MFLYRDKKNTIGAMSRYDVEYMRYYTGIDAMMVPIYSGFHMKGSYKPIYNNYLIVTITETWGNKKSWWAKLRENYVNSVKQVKKLLLLLNPDQIDVWEVLPGLGGGSRSPPIYLSLGATKSSKIIFL